MVFKKEKLGKLLSKVGSGVTPKGGSDSYVPEGVPLIRSQNVLWGKLSTEGIAFIDAQQHAKMSGSFVLPNDVLLNITGASIGRACVVPSSLGEANVNQHVCILRVGDKLDSEYLSNFLISQQGQREIALFQAGGNREGLNYEQVKSFEIPLPPLAEQRKIAEILRTWDEAIETAEAELKAKQERKRWLMDKLVDEGSVRGATGNCRIKSHLREITSMASGGTPKTSVPEYYGGSIPWVSISDMTSGTSYINGSKTRITEEGLSNSSARIFKKGTILFAMYASIGECRIAGLDLTTSQAILGITPGPSIRSEYLYYFLCRIKETAKSYGQTGTQANLNKGIVGDFEISLPTLEEQDRILDVLKTCDTDVEKATMMISSLRTQKRGLMQKLLTGEVRVAA